VKFKKTEVFYKDAGTFKGPI